MYKRIYKSFITIVGVTLLIVGCSKTETNPIVLHSKIDMSTSFFSADMYNSGLLFSTDGGTTYTQFPSPFRSGQTVNVKVLDIALGRTLSATSDFLIFDWSASTPQPDNAASDNPSFVYNGSSNFSVKITNAHCPYNQGFWSSVPTAHDPWSANEGTVEQDSLTAKLTTFPGTVDAVYLTPDATNPNKIWVDNFFGDGTGELIYMLFNTSTSAYDQNITIPVQIAPLSGLSITGSGSYDQCRGTASVNVVASYIDSTSYADTVRGYKFISPGVYKDTITKVIKNKTPKSYKWTYNFQQAPYCPFDASYWPGATAYNYGWIGVEGTVHQTNPSGPSFTGSNDQLTIVPDPSNSPNGFILGNLFGDGPAVTCTMVFTPSTSYYDQIVTIPSQTTSEGGVVSGTGTYDQCAGTIQILVSYTAFGATYTWNYKIAR